jgi:hypothetical protein
LLKNNATLSLPKNSYLTQTHTHTLNMASLKNLSNYKNQKVGGLGHGIQQRGRVAGLRGNSKPDRQQGAARIATGQVVVVAAAAARGIHRSAAQRGTRAKVPNITTAGENNKHTSKPRATFS